MRKATLISFLVLLVISVAAPAQQKSQIASEAATRWLGYVDAGDYAKSWDTASSMLQQQVSKEDWQKQMAALRGPLGAVVSRNEAAASYTTHFEGLPEGEYVVVRDQSTFEHKRSASETIVMTYDRNKWRVAGYFIK